MATIHDRFPNPPWPLLLLILVVLLPALCLHLGMLTYIDDEAIRALVALEMHLTQDYITPTLSGALYFNKPPLYNWFLLLFFGGFGAFTEWVSRGATVFCLLGFGLTIFVCLRKVLGRNKALMVVFMVITSFRILLYDSLLGLIDIGYSWAVFYLFWQVYWQSERRRWWQLFVGVYTLAAIGFLLKGLPIIVFTGASLIIWFSYRRWWRRLVSIQHLVGILLWLLLVGSYYYLYAQSNDVQVVFATLLEESSKRTAAQYGIGKTIQHLFTFPFELVYHFLPWSLLMIPALGKWIRARSLPQESFLAFAVLVGGVNLIPYWISVEVYPRYLFMFLPLLFSLALGGIPDSFWQRRQWFYWISGGLLSLLTLAATLPLFWHRLQVSPLWMPKGILLTAALATLLYFFWQRIHWQLWLLVLGLAIVRMGFDWFVLPDRYYDDWGTQVKHTTIEAVALVPQDKPLYIYGRTAFQPTNAFYATRTQQAIIPRKRTGFQPGDFLIIDTAKYPEIPIDWKADFVVRFKRKTIQVGEYRGE